MADFKIDVIVEPKGSGLKEVEKGLDELEQRGREAGAAISQSLSSFAGLESFQRDLLRQQQLVGASARDQELLQAQFRATDAAAAAGLRSVGGLNVLFADTARQVRAIQEARGRAGIQGTIADLQRQNELLLAETAARKLGTAEIAVARAVTRAQQQAQLAGIALTEREISSIRSLVLENERLTAARTAQQRVTAAPGASPLAGLVSTIAVTAAISSIGSLSDAYVQAQNRIRVVTDSQGELADVTQRLLRISNENRQSFASNVELYSRLAVNAQRLGRSQEELLDVTQLIGKAVIVSGASAQEASNGLVQLSQAIASNRLAGDELRSVLEQLPIVADVIAKRLGVTRGEIRALAADGKITGEVILSAFEQARDELDQRFAKTVPTVGQAFQVLRNDILSVVGATASSVSANETLAASILFVAENVDLLAVGVAALAGALGPVVLVKSIGLASRGLVALNAIVLANPWLALSAAVVGAGAALATYFANAEQARIDTEKLLGTVGALELKAREVERARFGAGFAEQSDNAVGKVRALEDEIAGLQKVIGELQSGGVASVDLLSRILPDDATIRDRVARIAQQAQDGSEVFVRATGAAFASLPLQADESIELIRARISRLAGELSAAKVKADLLDPESIKKAQDGLRDFSQQLEREAKVARLSGLEHDVLAAQLRAVDLAQRAGIAGSDAFGAAIGRVTAAVRARARAEGERNLEAFLQAQRDQIAAIQGQADAYGRGGTAVAVYNATLEAQRIALAAGIELTNEQRQAIESLVSAQQAAQGDADTAATIQALRARNEELRGQADALRISAEEGAVYLEVQRAVNAALSQGTTLTAAQIEQLRLLARENFQLSQEVSRFGERARETATSFGDGFRTAFEQSAADGRNFGQAGSETFGVLRDASAEAFAQLLTKGRVAYRELAASALAEINKILTRQLLLAALNFIPGVGAGASAGAAAGGGAAAAAGGGGVGGFAGIAGAASAAPISAASASAKPRAGVTLLVVNVTDPKEVQAAIASGEVDDVLVNAIGRRRSAHKRVLS